MGARPGPKNLPNFAPPRGLQKNQLAGVIFGCKHETFKECLSEQLFGLPSSHYSYVRNIDPGLPLFLFNYSNRKLHGIYEAASRGQMNINPHGWTIDGAEKTPFPAQVEVRVRLQCEPLLESQFNLIIEENYYNPYKFWFELDRTQARKLIAAFKSSAVSPATSVLPNTKKWRRISRGREENVHPSPPPLQANLSTQSSRNFKTAEPVSSFDGPTRSLEAQFDGKLIQQEAKGDDMSTKNAALDSAATKEANEENKVYEKDCDQNIPRTNDVFFEEKRVLAAEDLPKTSLPTQLFQEVEDLKIFKADQTQKMGKLEEKLARAENEIQFLKESLNLETKADSFRRGSDVDPGFGKKYVRRAKGGETSKIGGVA